MIGPRTPKPRTKPAKLPTPGSYQPPKLALPGQFNAPRPGRVGKSQPSPKISRPMGAPRPSKPKKR